MRFVTHHNHVGTPVVFCSGCGYSRFTTSEPTIGDLIERSSLGTPDAVAARAQVSDEEARRVVARAKQFGTDR